jgi:preprotein translocase subunit SecE
MRAPAPAARRAQLPGEAVGRGRDQGPEGARRGVLEKIKEFLLGVRAEMEKVAWPERSQVQSATILIVILVIIMAAIIGVLDLIITQVLGLFFKI